MKRLSVQVWSDIACPWCYVGKRRLEAALAKSPHNGAIDVVWRAFELDPGAPRVRPTDVSYTERLAKKYGSTTAHAQSMIDRMTEVAKQDGLDFRFDRIRPGNTFDAHRVIHLAHRHGKQDAVKERFLKAYMTEGEPIGERGALVRLAAEVGLDEEEVRATLETDGFAAEVRAEEEQARSLGISGVPFFVLGGHYALSGAQPVELFERALAQAWDECAEEPTFAEGAACGRDGCT